MRHDREFTGRPSPWILILVFVSALVSSLLALTAIGLIIWLIKYALPAIRMMVEISS